MRYTFIFLCIGIIIFSCSEGQYQQGAEIYKYYCSNCHMEEGQGIGSAYPPLKNSDWYQQNQDLVACLVRNGSHQAMKVNGKLYTAAMPANPKLSAIEITNLINFINNNWGNNLPDVTLIEIENQLNSCK